MLCRLLTMLVRIGFVGLLLATLVAPTLANSFLTDTADTGYQCALSVTPLVQGEYATAQVTVPAAVRESLGRLDMFVEGQPQAGGAWSGKVYRQLFKVGALAETLTVSYVVSDVLSERQLCAGRAQLAVRSSRDGEKELVVTLEAPADYHAPKFQPRGGQALCHARASGGRPPFKTVWYLDDKPVYTPTLKISLEKGSSTFNLANLGVIAPGERVLRVTVTDASGRSVSGSQRIRVSNCDSVITGPARVRVGEEATWTVKLGGQRPLEGATVSWLGGRSFAAASGGEVFTDTGGFDEPGSPSLQVQFRDSAGCRVDKNTYWLRVVGEKRKAQPAPGPSACRAGFRKACHDKYCCRPGAQCWDATALRRGDCYKR